MDLPIYLLALMMTTLALAHPAVVIAKRNPTGVTRIQSALMGLEAIALSVFLFSDDDYARDGRSNWSAYPVEYAAVPTIAALVATAVWLQRRANSREARMASPIFGLTLSLASLICLVLTNN